MNLRKQSLKIEDFFHLLCVCLCVCVFILREGAILLFMRPPETHLMSLVSLHNTNYSLKPRKCLLFNW